MSAPVPPKQTVNNADLLALKGYVKAADGSQYAALAQDTVMIDLTHSNLKQRHIEQRFDKHTTIEQLRERIYLKTGTPQSEQHLMVKDGYGTVVAEIPPSANDDMRKLGYFGMDHGWTVHCVDNNPHSGSARGGYEDVSKVEKYKMSDVEYDQRQGTLRDWGRAQKEKDANFSLAKHAREHREWAEARRQAKRGLELPKGFAYDENGELIREDEDDVSVAGSTASIDEMSKVYGPISVENIEVGMRCEVQPGGRQGSVQYVGEVPNLGGGGYWIGVRFDEPVGKTDGLIKGHRYFEAGPGCGGFVRSRPTSAMGRPCSSR